MKTLLQRSLFGLSALGLVLVGALPASAQAIRLGDDLEVDLTTPREREVQPRVTSDGDRVNVEVYERPAPQTEIRVDQGQFEIRRTEQEPQQRLNLSIPTN
jgi:hypothetical protein